ncbi:MAG TPA: heme exporter protein CcmB [Thermoanaerobaculia bacterium]
MRAALRKELLLQWRTRAQIMSVFVFGATSLLLFSFGVGPNSEVLRQFSAGFLWLGLLLSSTLTLAESFHAEMENRALEGLLLLPADPRALYYGKAIANWIQLSLLGTALVPVMVILYDAGTTRVLSLVGIIILGAAGLSAPGTLYAGMTAQVRAKQTLLPLLLFPLIVPALLASVKATSLVILGDPMQTLRSWLLLLASFDAIYWTLCGLLYPRVVED